MDMINVMNTSPMVEGNNWWIATLVCVIIGIISLILAFALGEYDTASLVMTILFILSFIVGLTSGVLSKNYIPEIYECTIKENIDANIFMETFIVDSQRGKIYVVHLKSNEK